MKKNEEVKIPKPKVIVDLEHLSINLVSIDKVKLYVQEVENLPWLSGFFFLFLGILFERLINNGLNFKDEVTVVIFLIVLVFLVLTVKQYLAKRKAWKNVEQSKIDVKEGDQET